LKALQSVFLWIWVYIPVIQISTMDQQFKEKNFTVNFQQPGKSSVCYYMLFFIIQFTVSGQIFVDLREQAINKENEKDKIEGVQFHYKKRFSLIMVSFMRRHDLSLFRLMPTGIKWYLLKTFFSNPYISLHTTRKATGIKMLT